MIREQPYQVMPPLDDEQRHALRQSIQANGVLEPIVVDEDGNILDGHHRAEIAEALEVDCPTRVLAGLDEAGKLRYAITTNAVRRQLAPAQVSSMVAHLRTKGMSIRQIATATGLPKSSVARQVDQVSQVGHLPEKVTGSDGKTYAATRPTQIPGPLDAAVSPPGDPGTTATPPSPPPSLEGDGGSAEPERPAPPKWDPAEREAHRLEVQRIQIIEDARRHAKTLVTTIRAEITTVIGGVDLGEHGLITEQMVADIRATVDLLASRLEVSA
jgi:hypothetical protein